MKILGIALETIDWNVFVALSLTAVVAGYTTRAGDSQHAATPKLEELRHFVTERLTEIRTLVNLNRPHNVSGPHQRYATTHQCGFAG
jgi:hypothetical protein